MIKKKKKLEFRVKLNFREKKIKLKIRMKFENVKTIETLRTTENSGKKFNFPENSWHLLRNESKMKAQQNRVNDRVPFA